APLSRGLIEGMASITVTTSHGQARAFETGTAALDVLKASGALNAQVVAAKVDGRVVDLSHRLHADGAVHRISTDSPERTAGQPRRYRVALPSGRVRRSLSRPTRARHRTDQSLQAHQPCGRVLARR